MERLFGEAAVGAEVLLTRLIMKWSSREIFVVQCLIEATW